MTQNTQNIATNTQNITNVTNRVTTVEGRVDTNTQNIASNTQNIATNRQSITSLQGNVSTNTTQIASLDGRVTTLEDAFSNFSNTVGGFNNRIAQVEENSEKALQGVAVAMSMADPVLVGGNTFGMRFNYGHYEGQSALGISVLGILGHNLLGGGETIAVGGSVGLGLNRNDVGGRLGVQLSW